MTEDSKVSAASAAQGGENPRDPDAHAFPVRAQREQALLSSVFCPLISALGLSAVAAARAFWAGECPARLSCAIAAVSGVFLAANRSGVRGQKTDDRGQ
jgi:hypothetical protein